MHLTYLSSHPLVRYHGRHFMKYQLRAPDVGCSLVRRPAVRLRSGTPVVFLTAGHSACERVAAMRSLTGALESRHDQEGASRHRPGGHGCRDGHARCPHAGRERGHAARHQAPAAPARPPGPDRAIRGRRRSRLRPGGPGDLRRRAAGERREVPVPARPGRTPPGSRPRAVPGITRRRRPPCSGARPCPGGTRPGSGSRPGRRPGPGRRPRRTRRNPFRPPAGAQAHERIHPRRPDRRAARRPRPRPAG